MSNYSFFDKRTGEVFIVEEEDFITATEVAEEFFGNDIEFLDIERNEILVEG